MKYQTANRGYKVIGYAPDSASSSEGYSVAASSPWVKSTCCGAFRFGSRCSDCPGGY